MPRHRAAAALPALLLLLGAVTGACTQQGDPSPEELQEDLSEELRERNPDLTADQADCYAELLVEELGVDAVMDVDFSDEEPSADLAEGIATAAAAARDDCGLTDAPG